MHCVLVGNYGIANLGDEALREYFLEAFPDIRWTVVSARPTQPGEIHRLPGGLRSLFSMSWWKTVKTIRQADAVVFGGGSLFTDIESVYACVLWGFHVAVARLCGTPVFMAFQGMGPYRTTMGERLARWSAGQAQFLSVRDTASAERVQKWNLSIKVVQTFDPVFAHMQNKKKTREPKNVFIAVPRHNSDILFCQEAQKIITRTSNIDEVHIVLMQPDDPAERSFAESLHAELPLPATIVPVRSLDELMDEVSGAQHVLSQRFHGALAALAADSPLTVLPQGKGDKLWELKKYEGEHPDIDSLLQAVSTGEAALRSACFLGLKEAMRYNKA